VTAAEEDRGEQRGELALLRHTVATVAYRAAKALRGAPPEFAGFRAADDLRTPAEILAHMGDLYEWAVHMLDGEHVWEDSAPLAWEAEVKRFVALLERFDTLLADLAEAGAEPGFPVGRIFQGPLADSLNHVGQLTLLRRMAGAPIRGENYFLAEITPGRLGLEQAEPKREFD